MGSEMQHLLEEAVSSGMFLGVSCIAIDSAGKTMSTSCALSPDECVGMIN